MTRSAKLDENALAAAEAELSRSGWRLSEDKAALEKNFRFKGFPEAMTFMSMAAWHAQAKDHHPEWFNVYNKVDVRLTTHDADGITELDVALARHMDEAAAYAGETA